MSPEPPRPNKPVLKSAEKIRDLQDNIEALHELLADYRQLVKLITERISAPVPQAGYESMLGYQREIAQWVRAALNCWPDEPGPAFEFLQANWPDVPYQVAS